MSKEAMKLALKALQVATTPLARDRQEVLRAQAALRQVLANEALDRMAENARELGLDYEPAQQEPVEWLTGCPSCGMDSCDCDEGTWNPPAQQEPVYVYTCKGCEALYRENDVACDCTVGGLMKFNRHLLLNDTSPPQRTWVGLTDDEILYCVELENPKAIAEEVEAKLKEKNT